MKIINVTPGLLPIPPNGWGAVEKIIWEIHQNLLKLGHDSQIKYLNEIPTDVDIVHIHVANLANEAHDKGIKYWFTMHDHHAFLYGKESQVYKENLKAIKNAVKAFVPAKYLIDYFEGVPEYFSHGVNTDYFKYTEYNNEFPKLLCVANNGFIHNQAEDRKGFGPAIEAARVLGLPITIAGPSNNKKYFDKYPANYDKTTILYDLKEDELLKLYQTHHIFINASVLEAGHPNLTILEAISCGMPVVSTYEDNNELGGMVKCTRSVRSISDNISLIQKNYTSFKEKCKTQAIELSWKNRTIELLKQYGALLKTPPMKEKLVEHYTNTIQLNKPSQKYRPKYNINNIDGMFAEVLGDKKANYKARFLKQVNNTTNEELYSVDMANNCWAKSSIRYYVDWKVEIEDLETKDTFEYKLDLKDQSVYIALDSKSIGDTLAWFPYVDEFRKKHNCKMICSTFWNDWFEKEYPHINFIKPGTPANNIIAMYTIGIFYNSDGFIDTTRHPINPLTQPLQKIASDILGLKYKEIKPRIKKLGKKTNPKKYVAIGFHSTSQAKYWNNPTGWQEVANYINLQKYDAIMISNEGSDYMGNKYPTNVISVQPQTIEDAIEWINGSEFFIGISSGLSWLAWALGKRVVLISGFTDENLEFTDCIRIINKSVCNGCWSRNKFDPGNWNWCPEHEKTARQFECTKTISGNEVIQRIKNLFI